MVTFINYHIRILSLLCRVMSCLARMDREGVRMEATYFEAQYKSSIVPSIRQFLQDKAGQVRIVMVVVYKTKKHHIDWEASLLTDHSVLTISPSKLNIFAYLRPYIDATLRTMINFN